MSAYYADKFALESIHLYGVSTAVSVDQYDTASQVKNFLTQSVVAVKVYAQDFQHLDSLKETLLQFIGVATGHTIFATG